MITETAARELAADALGVGQDVISAWYETKEVLRVEIVIEKGVTFAMLQKLSDALGTEQINIEPAEPGHNYSSWTYDEGSPAKLVALLGRSEGGRGTP